MRKNEVNVKQSDWHRQVNEMNREVDAYRNERLVIFNQLRIKTG